ncbi:MAG: FimV family protein, partial [Guyparkeria sp.]
MRKLSLVIAGILGAGSPLLSQAATLGDARVQSNLTEPLEVSVPLARSSNEPLDEISVQLAPPAFYEQAGVPLESLPSNLVFSVETRGDQDYVLIRSRGPVRDPILNILLEVRSPEGRMIREYSLLLDPPSSDARSESTAQDVATSAPADRAPAQRAGSSTWERVAPASDLELDDSYTVEQGDTLSRIASRYAADGEDIRPIMQAIIDANPDAFVDGNGNALMADAELKVPSGQPTADDDAASD